jgi:hypothetical protein
MTKFAGVTTLSTTTLRIMTISIMTHKTLALDLSVLIMNVSYTECHK